MPNSYTKSKLADKDILHITKRSLKDFGGKQTDTYMNGLEETLNMLARTPERGRVFTHGITKRNYFFYRYTSHVIYYRHRKTGILSRLFFIRKCFLKNIFENRPYTIRYGVKSLV